VLRGEQRVQMRQVVERVRPSRRRRSMTAIDLEAPVDHARLDRLKEWRRTEARRQSVPASVILHDATVTEIARRQPDGLDALADIPGIGAKKLERYGDAIVELLRSESGPQ
jgi:ATP-dependent DNA helicase RecQ